MKTSSLKAAGVAALFLFIASAVASAEGEKTVNYNGHTYTLFETGCTWEEAKRSCEEQGGHLATITSRKEQKAIATLVKEGEKKFYWVGGYIKSARTARFTWITGEKFSYTSWTSGAPSDSTMGKKDAMMIYKSTGNWKDENGEKPGGSASSLKKYGYVCEWDDEDFVGFSGADSAYDDYDEDEDFSDEGQSDIGISIPAGKKVKLFGPEGAKWTSSDPSVAKVNKNGVVMAVSKGTAVISVQGAGTVTVRVEE